MLANQIGMIIINLFQRDTDGNSTNSEEPNGNQRMLNNPLWEWWIEQLLLNMHVF